jgi:hypothetical protein
MEREGRCCDCVVTWKTIHVFRSSLFCLACGTKQEKGALFSQRLGGRIIFWALDQLGRFFSRWEGRFRFKGLERRMSTPAASQ